MVSGVHEVASNDAASNGCLNRGDFVSGNHELASNDAASNGGLNRDGGGDFFVCGQSHDEVRLLGVRVVVLNEEHCKHLMSLAIFLRIFEPLQHTLFVDMVDVDAPALVAAVNLATASPVFHVLGCLFSSKKQLVVQRCVCFDWPLIGTVYLKASGPGLQFAHLLTFGIQMQCLALEFFEIFFEDRHIGTRDCREFFQNITSAHSPQVLESNMFLTTLLRGCSCPDVRLLRFDGNTGSVFLVHYCKSYAMLCVFECILHVVCCLMVEHGALHILKFIEEAANGVQLLPCIDSEHGFEYLEVVLLLKSLEVIEEGLDAFLRIHLLERDLIEPFGHRPVRGYRHV